MPRNKFLATIRDKAKDSPTYVKKGGGFTKKKDEARRFIRRTSTTNGRLVGALDTAKKQAAIGQLYDAESVSD